MRKTAVLLALIAMSMSDAFAAAAGTPIASKNYVDEALESLDATKMGADGSYIQYVSETDGIVSATPKAFDSAMSSTSTNAVQNKVVNTALSKKQNNLSTAQLNAANSGITADKVATYDAYATGKQDTLVPDTNIKGSGSVTVTKGTDGVITVSGATLPTATADTLGGVMVDTALSSTSTNPVQNKAVYSALSGKLSTTGTAAKATADASGNNIVNTYATKVALAEGLAGKQDTLVPDTNIKGSGSVTVTKGTDGVITVSGVQVDTALSSTSTNPVQNKAVNTAISNLQTAVDGKQATLTTSNVTSTGGGNVVTAVTASNGTVTVTKGTTLGSLATKSAVGSSDITDGGVALADLASSSVNSAKIVDGSIATVDIANGAVTAVKTTGIFGFIPSGSEGSSTTATIWVE